MNNEGGRKSSKFPKNGSSKFQNFQTVYEELIED